MKALPPDERQALVDLHLDEPRRIYDFEEPATPRTVSRLVDRGWIAEEPDRFGLLAYRLTNAGRQAYAVNELLLTPIVGRMQ